MKKYFFHYLLMAVLCCGLSMSFVACSDDDKDDDNLTPEQREEQQAQQADRFWSVVSQLANPLDETDDYADKTYEPTIGQPSEANPYVRIVATNDLLSAAQRFAELTGTTVGTDFKADDAEYTWKDDAVGTLVYHATQSGNSLATVDVNIRQMPHLQQIVYQAPEQAGTNLGFNGSAYYRFGDVIRTLNADNKEEYWICVRPAFGPEGKRESHWVSLSPLSSENVKVINKSGKEYAVPTKLGIDTEHMQNLAEMIFAMMHPEEWYKNTTGNSAPGVFSSGLRCFHDFSHSADKLKYHNAAFWHRVRDAWDSKGLFKKIFGFESTDEHFYSMFKGEENEIYKDDSNIDGKLHLLYKGYSWKWGSSMTLYECSYTNPSNSKGHVDQLNMHKAEKKEYTVDMTDVGFNVNSEYTASGPYLMKSSFFGDKAPRYIIRHATGDDLMARGTSWDYKQPINRAAPVYVYNSFFYPEGTQGGQPGNSFRDLTLDPEVTLDPDDVKNQDLNEYIGQPFFFNGDVFIDEEGCRWFCIMNAGGTFPYSAPYSYFISFDDIKTQEINGNTVATNIVGERMLPKILPILSMHIRTLIIEPNKKGLNNAVSASIRELTGVDLSKMAVVCDSTVVQNNGVTDRREIVMLTAAYMPEGGGGSQLMRYVNENATDKTGNRQWRYWLNTKYPGSQEPILLADIAKQDKVNRWATDEWAWKNYHADDQHRKPVRTQADQRATNINNYLWGLNDFNTDAMSMWNEPVLVFRATKVYDRGIGNRGFKSYHGQHIKHIIKGSLHSMLDTADPSMVYIYWTMEYGGINLGNLMTMDGQPFQLPDWYVDTYE